MKRIGAWLLWMSWHIGILAQTSEDVSGRWVGLLTQEQENDADVIASRYHFELELQPDGAGRWKGSSFSFVKRKGGKRYVLRLRLEGIMRNDTLLLQERQELEYLNEINGKLSYCLKKMQLVIADEGGKKSLRGVWEGISPTSGARRSLGKAAPHRPAVNPAEIDTLTTFRQGRAVMLENRKVKSGHQLFFASGNLTLKIFDEGKEDGDALSLLYNNQWILKNYKLKNEPRIIKVRASPERLNNFLICYVHGMSKRSLRTTAAVVSDGKREKKVVLNSDLDSCDIVYFEIED